MLKRDRLINMPLAKVLIRHLREHSGQDKGRGIFVNAQWQNIFATREGDLMLQSGLERIETVRSSRLPSQSGQNITTDRGLDEFARLQDNQFKEIGQVSAEILAWNCASTVKHRQGAAGGPLCTEAPYASKLQSAKGKIGYRRRRSKDPTRK